MQLHFTTDSNFAFLKGSYNSLLLFAVKMVYVHKLEMISNSVYFDTFSFSSYY